MAWPPPVLPVNRTDATPQQGTHPADHNAANLAINDIMGELGPNPSLNYPTVTDLLLQVGDYFTPNVLEGVDQWTSGRGFEIQSNTSVVTTDASGNGTVAFIKAFGRAPIVLMTPGDDTGAYVFTNRLATRSTTGFGLKAVIPWTGANAANIQVRVNWLAIAARA